VTQHEPLIIHVTAYYPPRLGGLERVAQNLAEMLAERRDVEVVTTTCGMGGSPPATGPPRLRVSRFPALEVAHTPLSVQLVLRLLAAPRRAIVHVHVAQAFLPEVVWLTSAIRRRPYVVHFHLDVDASGRLGRLLPAYKRFVLGPVLRRAAAVLALSPQQAESIVALHGVRSDRITIMPNGVD
jgi:glycosyltransferase involved in cell wall biosynthesis